MAKVSRANAFLCICLLLWSAQLSAAPPAPTAVLYATGEVRVNDAAVVRSTSVFVGDQVSVGPGAAGTLNLTGGSVLLQEGARVAVGDRLLRINAGAATVRTTQPMQASAGAWEVVPQQDSSRFNVSRDQRSVTVSALQGDLVVRGVGRTIKVPSGTFVTLVAEPPASGDVDLGTATHGVVIGLGAIGITGIIAAAVLRHSPSSPSGP